MIPYIPIRELDNKEANPTNLHPDLSIKYYLHQNKIIR